MLPCEIGRGILRFFEIPFRIRRQLGWLEPDFVDIRDSGLIQQLTHVSRMMVDTERRGRKVRRKGARGQQQRRMLVLEQTEISRLGFQAHSRPGWWMMSMYSFSR